MGDPAEELAQLEKEMGNLILRRQAAARDRENAERAVLAIEEKMDEILRRQGEIAEALKLP